MKKLNMVRMLLRRVAKLQAVCRKIRECPTDAEVFKLLDEVERERIDTQVVAHDLNVMGLPHGQFYSLEDEKLNPILDYIFSGVISNAK